MPLLLMFGIGMMEIIILLGCFAVFIAIIVGVIVAITAANRGKDNRRE